MSGGIVYEWVSSLLVLGHFEKWNPDKETSKEHILGLCFAWFICCNFVSLMSFRVFLKQNLSYKYFEKNKSNTDSHMSGW